MQVPIIVNKENSSLVVQNVTSVYKENNSQQISESGVKLYTVKPADSHKGCTADGQQYSTVIGCHGIDINTDALGADKIVVTNFDRVEFSLPRTFENLTTG